MRFAYIDSHGNEVPIPSVDALALRIELGAVGPETQLYDAQADHWGPAKTHEIFHTLSRDAGDEGFVPPPPVAPPSVSAPEPTPPAAPSQPAPRLEKERPGKAEPPKKKEAPKKKPNASEGSKKGVDLGLTLADPPLAPPSKAEPEQDDAAAASSFSDIDLDLAPSPAAEPGPRPAGPPVGEGGGFDFGDLGGGLELEQGASGDMQLESPMELTTGGSTGGGDDLLLETPMSHYQPDAPPGWMEEERAGGDEEVMDFSAVSAEVAAEEEVLAPPTQAPSRERRGPKDRPSAPRFKRQRSLSGPIIFVLLLLTLGVGGYVGWPILSARLAQSDPTARPAVVMPAISPELLPRMHELADLAIADAVQQAIEGTASPDAPPEPSQDWLAGRYLGNASEFAGTEQFWLGIGRFVDALRAGDPQIYHDALVARVGAAGLSAEESAIVVERADSGFVAAEQQRMQTYDAVERLVLASLDLHDFLIENEESIEYRPASSSTADPVLEAVPSSQAIGDRMWDMVEAITESLDALGSLDRVTRERLTSAVQARLQENGVQ